jgi:hypothetical protein
MKPGPTVRLGEALTPTESVEGRFTPRDAAGKDRINRMDRMDRIKATLHPPG